jgi:hypothetical protein
MAVRNKCQKKCDASQAVSISIPTEQHCNKAAGPAIRGFVVGSARARINIFVLVARDARHRGRMHVGSARFAPL